MWSKPCANRTSVSRPVNQVRRPTPREATSSCPSMRRAAGDGRRVRRRHRQDRIAGSGHPAARCGARGNGRIQLLADVVAQQQACCRDLVLEAPGANAIEISDQVRAKMDELAKRFPEGVEWSVEYDSTVFVRQSIKAVVNTLLEAIGLVVLVVILFLQTWRASIIPLLAVPVSVVGTFAVLLMLGFSINTLTLLDSCLPSGSWWTTRSWWWKTSSATSPKGWRRWLRPIRPCAKSVAPSSPSRWCCARYSCLWHSCPA